MEHQVARGIDFELIGALDFQLNRFGVCPRSNYEVVLQLPLVAVVDEVHAWINILIPHLGIARNVGPPLLWIAADEVIAYSREFFGARHPRPWIGPDQPHADHSRLGRLSTFDPGRRWCGVWPVLGHGACMGASQRQHRLPPASETACSPLPRDRNRAWGAAWPLVGLEGERQFSVGFYGLFRAHFADLRRGWVDYPMSAKKQKSR